MAILVSDSIMEKLISAGFRYLKDQVRWQKRMKEDLKKLQENLPRIRAVVHCASSRGEITDRNSPFNRWLWQLRDATDDVDDVVDELEYMELEEQVTKNKKLRRVRSIMKFMKKTLDKIGKRALKIDPTLKRLEDAVRKLVKVSDDVNCFLHLVEKPMEAYFNRDSETGSLPTTNDLIRRGEYKDYVTQWLKQSGRNNISLLSTVGYGGMGKTTLLQHIYEDEEITKEFDLKMWVYVSNNFDVKKVIADMLECLKKERLRLELLGEFKRLLEEVVMSKKFLLVLDVEDEEKDKIKWEDVLAPLASGAFGSKILVTTRMDSVALMFSNVIGKSKEIIKLYGLEEDECLQLLYSHAFAGVVNPPDDHEKLRAIAREIVKKLLGSPLAAKVIGGVLSSELNERHWRTVLESYSLDQNSINSILSLSYHDLPNYLKICFAFCCMFPKYHKFYKDDFIRMCIALGFIQPSLDQETMEDTGGRYFDDLVKRYLFVNVRDYYRMHDLILDTASEYFALECGKLVDDEEPFLKITETIRHLSIQTGPNILRKIEKFKHLSSLYLFSEDSNQDLYSALVEIFKVSKSLRLLYIFAPFLTKIPEEIGNLKHLRYLKIYSQRLTMMPRSLSKLYHLQYIIHDSLGFPSQYEVDFLPRDITNLSNLCYLSIGPIVPVLREIPNLPPSLKSLRIWRCHPELKERYREDGGSDWHKIAHIPHIFIGP